MALQFLFKNSSTSRTLGALGIKFLNTGCYAQIIGVAIQILQSQSCFVFQGDFFVKTQIGVFWVTQGLIQIESRHD